MNKSQIGVIKSAVRGLYDLQKLRIQTGLRVVANFKAKLGQQSTKTEEELESEAKKILDTLRCDYKLITDAIVASGKRLRANKKELFLFTNLISNEAEYDLVASYMDLSEAEVKNGKSVARLVKDTRLWTEFLEGVTGCGPLMAGVIMSEIDIHKATYPSSLWKYAGLDVAPDGKGRSRKVAHLVEVHYQDKNGKDATRNSITHNPFLKTKLIGVLGTCFVKLGGKYRLVYDNYKNRLQNRPDLKEESKGHINNMAIRYAVKMFLIDLHREWRTIEGLSVPEPYHVAKLGMRDHNKAA